MYERFTDRARTVMLLANQEAQRMNHEYVEPAHILIGLLKEGSGIAAHVLTKIGMELGAIRRVVEKHLPSGPDMITMGRLPQTPQSKKVIEQAIREAEKLNHNYVGTEHLLLGLIGSNDQGEAVPAAFGSLTFHGSIRGEIMELIQAVTNRECDKQVVGSWQVMTQIPKQKERIDWLAERIDIATQIAVALVGRGEAMNVAERACDIADGIVERLQKHEGEHGQRQA